MFSGTLNEQVSGLVSNDFKALSKFCFQQTRGKQPFHIQQPRI